MVAVQRTYGMLSNNMAKYTQFKLDINHLSLYNHPFTHPVFQMI